MRCRQEYLDFWGSEMQLPVTIVDRRKNQYNAQYTVRVFRKGMLLAERVDIGEWFERR